ncbi:MAG: YbaK/EbsC family protein [Chloroflexi bacterium]|nr:YbaK/EbsC family protein [Chloroflexota bacterium]
MIPTLFTPSDPSTNSGQALARFTADHGIAAELVVPPVETPTVVAAAAALGIEPGQVIKSLLFLVRDEPVLVIASGAAPVDRSILAGRFGVGKKQIKLADAETVARLTGYPVGGVPPFGHPAPILTLLDRAVLAWDVIYGGGGDERTLLRIAPGELARVTGAELITLAG